MREIDCMLTRVRQGETHRGTALLSAGSRQEQEIGGGETSQRKRTL